MSFLNYEANLEKIFSSSKQVSFKKFAKKFLDLGGKLPNKRYRSVLSASRYKMKPILLDCESSVMLVLAVAAYVQVLEEEEAKANDTDDELGE